VTRFAPWTSPAWEAWRRIEREGTAPHRFCPDCGWVHRLGNHGPKNAVPIDLDAPDADVPPRPDRSA
jgi:hypothetical protein